ncbi:VOC family protein [Halomonas sp. ML-15]|uniref:VOC family protein n=1 Tax=Halomonas sp. ML-15 TaxID=2773305 RepID=UPI0017465F2D|nr:VOC family protein [Halomonas sp. ML-15]MBD3895113.1 VOC family protein [Halomonas sp. ML-15]
MSTTRFDHLVVAAESVSAGVDYLERHLGVRLPEGGEHPRMATHNHLMQLSQSSFLEVIATDPDAAPPARPRWFGLDDPYVRASLAASPRLLTWAVNTSSLDALELDCVPLGRSEPMSRGDLNWDITIPPDGSLAAGGLLPVALQWHADTHPAGRMQDLGCRLTGLTLYHPRADWLSTCLQRLGAAELARVEGIGDAEGAWLEAELETPLGRRVLSSRDPHLPAGV